MYQILDFLENKSLKLVTYVTDKKLLDVYEILEIKVY